MKLFQKSVSVGKVTNLLAKLLSLFDCCSHFSADLGEVEIVGWLGVPSHTVVVL